MAPVLSAQPPRWPCPVVRGAQLDGQSRIVFPRAWHAVPETPETLVRARQAVAAIAGVWGPMGSCQLVGEAHGARAAWSDGSVIAGDPRVHPHEHGLNRGALHERHLAPR